MGIKGERVKKDAAIIREIFYKDGYACKTVEEYQYDTYILDNKTNEQVLDGMLNTEGIQLCISPTGSGKTASFLMRARELVAGRHDIMVVFAVPTRTVAIQVGNEKDVSRFIGGDDLDKSANIICCTYEKVNDVKSWILHLRNELGVNKKCILIIDECHNLANQQLFRKDGIRTMIHAIEKKVFQNTILITATPYAMALFHYNRIIEFMSKRKKPAMDKLKILFVDDALEYIKTINLSKVFPIILLNSKKKIDYLMKSLDEGIVKLTNEDKETVVYQDIAENSKIDNKELKGILSTSVIGEGVNIVDYPDNAQMFVAVTDRNISVDLIEQFLNRARRTATKSIQCATIILPKMKEAQVDISDANRIVCSLKQVETVNDVILVSDTDKLDSLNDGVYKVSIEVGRKTLEDHMFVETCGSTYDNVYCKDRKPLMFQNIPFRSVTDIVSDNYKKIMCFQDIMQKKLDILNAIRAEEEMVNGDYAMWQIELMDQKLMAQVTRAAIDSMEELKECLSYENGKIVVDKRILFLLSYQMFQRQYFYSTQELKKELEQRMGLPVDIIEGETKKVMHKKIETDNIWEGLTEDIRQSVACDDAYFDSLMYEHFSVYVHTPDGNEMVSQIREQGIITVLAEELQKAGVPKGVCLGILKNSQKKAKVTKYKNACKVIINNQMLDRMKYTDISSIPLYSKQLKDKLQVVIYCLLTTRKQTCYKLTKQLTEDVIAAYKKAFPSSKKLPTQRQVMSKLKQMYKPKGKDSIRNELYLKEDEIFKLIKSDFK